MGGRTGAAVAALDELGEKGLAWDVQESETHVLLCHCRRREAPERPWREGEGVIKQARM